MPTIEFKILFLHNYECLQMTKKREKSFNCGTCLKNIISFAIQNHDALVKVMMLHGAGGI